MENGVVRARRGSLADAVAIPCQKGTSDKESFGSRRAMLESRTAASVLLYSLAGESGRTGMATKTSLMGWREMCRLQQTQGVVTRPRAIVRGLRSA